jgi:hypothetical protein
MTSGLPVWESEAIVVHPRKTPRHSLCYRLRTAWAIGAITIDNDFLIRLYNLG